MDLKSRANKLKTDLPAIFLALKRKDTPMTAKVMAGLTLLYALSPIDLIPDFVPVLGYLDDVILLPLFIALTVKLIPHEIMQECKREAEGLWQNGKPKKWIYAIPTILIWILVCWVILSVLL